ncbi:MAG TPA: DUF456 domain-containing protein [Acidimicrobiia bacterium]|nr:DUF456 domain-containing protein [Acidimicrobiia bacterium]
MDIPGLIAVGLAIAIGLVGIVVAALPGLILVWGAVLVWALVEKTTVAWVVLGVATALLIFGQIGKYLVPGRRLREAGVPRRSLVIGGLLSIVGFFLIPVVGFIVGFVVGVYLSERQRLISHQLAWPSTRKALSAAGLSILIELASGLLIAGTWLAVVLFT